MSKQHRSEIEEKILESAGEVFAVHGFQGATVREICARAGTNVASINYYFGDKAALYAKVLQYSHGCACAQYPAEQESATPLTPEQKLFVFVFNFLGRLIEKGKPTWHGRLMSRELMEPTSALGELIDSCIKPQFAIVRAIIAELSGRSDDDQSVVLCAGSVIGQCLHYHHARHVIERLAPEHILNERNREHLARHITDFTLSAIKGLPAGY